jgi:hypothetical protein
MEGVMFKGVLFLFIGVIDMMRLASGGDDSIFGTRWLLALFAVYFITMGGAILTGVRRS